MDAHKLNMKRARRELKAMDELHNGRSKRVSRWTGWDHYTIGKDGYRLGRYFIPEHPINKMKRVYCTNKVARMTLRTGAKPNKETRDHNRKAFLQIGHQHPTNRELETGVIGHKRRKAGRHPRHNDLLHKSDNDSKPPRKPSIAEAQILKQNTESREVTERMIDICSQLASLFPDRVKHKAHECPIGVKKWLGVID